MDDIGNIGIEGQKLAFDRKNIHKLTQPEGCQLQAVNVKSDLLEDFDSEDIDFEEIEDHSDKFAAYRNNISQIERCKREYISLVLNANRDPIKPGIESKFKELQEANEREEVYLDTLPNEHACDGILGMYKDVGNYENYMKRNSFEEVTPGRVYKKKRVPGVQLPVTEKSLVIYNCAFWTENSQEPYDSTWLRQTTLTSHIETDSMLPGLRDLLLTTKKGELCEAFIRPEAAFGALGAMPRIPPNATIFCVLEVVKVVTEDKIATIMQNSQDSPLNLVFEDYLEAADEARRRGNYYYEHDKYKVALQRYKSGIRLLESLRLQNEVQEKKAQDLLVKLFNNCARAANAAGIPRLALAFCKQASEIDYMVPKTYWHRLTAWRTKGHPDRALGVARRALQLFDDQSIRKPFLRAAEDLKRRIQMDEQELDDLHRLMGRAIIGSPA